MKRLLALWVYNPVFDSNDGPVPEAMDVLLCYINGYINGAFGALMMVGLGVTSLILAVVASTAPTRRRGWVIASILCAILAVGLYVLRGLIGFWFTTTPAGI